MLRSGGFDGERELNICKYFGITPKEFFDDGQRAPEKLRHLMDELVQLSDAQLEAVTAVVENMRKP